MINQIYPRNEKHIIHIISTSDLQKRVLSSMIVKLLIKIFKKIIWFQMIFLNISAYSSSTSYSLLICISPDTCKCGKTAFAIGVQCAAIVA